MNVTKSIVLKSDTLILKELEPDNVTNKYVNWLNDPEVNQYLESRFVQQNKHTVKMFVKNCKNSKVDFIFGIFLLDGVTHIGNIKLGPVSVYHKHASIGIMIGDKEYWGKGFESQAISMITQFGFNQLKLEKLCAGCYESNIGSKKAFEKSGYQVEGFIKNHVNSINGREGSWMLGCSRLD